ncbi:MAG: type I methionyl aminopeptidase [Patescibacteria group bacterium]
MALIKDKKQIEILFAGGRILAQILDLVKKEVNVGVTTEHLSNFAENLIIQAGGAPSFKGYGGDRPFPATLCVSVNEELVHGLPSKRVLQNGDLVGLDIGMRYPARDGLYTDHAITVGVGKITKNDRQLMRITAEALDIWIGNLRAGADLNLIAKKVQQHIERNKFSVVRDLVGHGVGFEVHEDPAIPNYYSPFESYIVEEGEVLALEPMVSAGGFKIKTKKDGWTVVMADGSRCAHFEHTVLIMKDGCKIVTK